MIDRGAQASPALVSSGNPRAPVAGVSAAIENLAEATDDASADEAWARIDQLLHQVRQLTLGGSDREAASATTTAQAISAYAGHATAERRAG